MTQWSNSTISRFAQLGEEELASELKLITDRYSLVITGGEPEYDLPSYVLGVTQITWEGKPLDPRTGGELIRSGSSPTGTSHGEPKEYVYSNLGQKKIRFYPTPPASISAPSNPWTVAAIQSGVIVEFYRLPDIGAETYRIPLTFRRQIIKDYVMYRLFGLESGKQDKLASSYFLNKWQYDKDLIRQILARLFAPRVKIMGEQISRPIIARPVLPPMFPRRRY